MPSHHGLDIDAELSVLDALTSDTPVTPNPFRRRDSEIDPLLLAAAFSSGPHVTRNHYAHDFFPPVADLSAPGTWDWSKWTGQSNGYKADPEKVKYVSQQAPRRQRLKEMGVDVDAEDKRLGLTVPENVKPQVDDEGSLKRLGLTAPEALNGSASENLGSNERLGLPPPQELTIKCMARTRIPTPHGPAFLHIYHNNRDNKEHLAIVIDPAQFSEEPSSVPSIRSSSLDAVWDPAETPMDRITRGAYVGRLSPTNQTPSGAPSSSTKINKDVPAPLIRIHSECFTGETIGSMRCDCGEQLDEAIRLISQPITLPNSKTIPGRGAVVYLRQEGRGIGLLSKIRAYNLQDLGHDTVTANLMLGHQADERGYEIAGAILKDLGMGADGIRLLTNNPDKVQALQKEGVRISQRVQMIPRSWRIRDAHTHANTKDHEHPHIAGATLIGGGAVHGQDLDKYLRTKVLRMGHMLPLYDEVEGLGVMYE